LKNDDLNNLKLGWSDFAAGRHLPGGKHTWLEGTADELLDLVRKGWEHRRPGAGRDDLNHVVVVPVAADRFVGNSILVHDETVLHAHLDRRQRGEDAFIRITAEGEREPSTYASVVLYSAETLTENDGSRSGDYDWEVVCLLAGPVETEPMDPLTMARNMLEKPGGTYAPYTAEQFAESIDYWSCRATAHVPKA
jgi:hypothetical protein